MKNIKIVSYNLRFCWTADGVNSFIHRYGLIVEKILKSKPDVIAFQECSEQIIDFLKRALPEYEFVGHYREADFTGEGIFTAMRKDTFELIGYESFWMSPTPYVAGSRYEKQSICPRICVVTQFLHKASRKLFRVFNLHLDHESDEARILGMGCVFERVEELNSRLNLPYIILGDFNAQPGSTTIEMCDNHENLVRITGELGNTFHNFGKDGVTIDYIYMTKDLADNVVAVEKWTDEINGIYLSDHYPISAEFEL